MANRLLFLARGVEEVHLNFPKGYVYYKQPGTIFYLSVSNDLSIVPPDYNDDEGALRHLRHLKGLGSITGTFRTPELDTMQQTGKPICNGTIVVGGGGCGHALRDR